MSDTNTDQTTDGLRITPDEARKSFRLSGHAWARLRAEWHLNADEAGTFPTHDLEFVAHQLGDETIWKTKFFGYDMFLPCVPCTTSLTTKWVVKTVLEPEQLMVNASRSTGMNLQRKLAQRLKPIHLRKGFHK